MGRLRGEWKWAYSAMVLDALALSLCGQFLSWYGHIWAYAVRYELIRPIPLGWIRSVPAKYTWLNTLELMRPSELIRPRLTKMHLPTTKKQQLTELIRPIRYTKLRMISSCRLDTLTWGGLGSVSGGDYQTSNANPIVIWHRPGAYFVFCFIRLVPIKSLLGWRPGLTFIWICVSISCPYCHSCVDLQSL